MVELKRSFAVRILLGAAFLPLAVQAATKWGDCLKQKAEWYAGSEAQRIADNVLLYQRSTGGWPKNIDMAAELGDAENAEVRAAKSVAKDSLIDNGATYTQMQFLAKVYAARKEERWKDAFLKGLDYLLTMQTPTGGWPQYYPNEHGYYKHITFNDDAMINVMRTLREIAEKKPPYAFVDEERRAKTAGALRKGVECILKCQIKTDSKLTGWCAQHDRETLAPAPARAYEKVSLSGSEAVGIVRFLMSMDKPAPEVIESVQAAVAWFDKAKLTGIRVDVVDGDKRVVQDPAAPPLWARFYEIGTNKPIFCSRDGVVRYDIAEISSERRNGYAWHGNWPATLLESDYPAWQKKWAPDQNVLAK